MGSPNNDEQQPPRDTGNDAGNPPPPPEPEKDAGIVPPIKSPSVDSLDHLTPDNVDIFALDPSAALKLLCRGTQLLVDLTGDVPPTPAARSPGHGLPPQETKQPRKQSATGMLGFSSRNENEQIDGVPFQRTPIGSPEAQMQEPIVHGTTAQPASVQYAALIRKFYSKRPPPISLEDYLLRMHKYCPMSTAVYLATSCYISHLAVKEKLCPVTPRNVHRLVLAGLRIAMKALEDFSWQHERFAKVGGISEPELARLEVGFCFLMDFSLRVDADILTEEARNLVRITNSSAVAENDADTGGFQLVLPDSRKRSQSQTLTDTTNGANESNGLSTPRSTAEKRKASSSLPMRPVQHVGQGIGIVGQS